MRFRTMPDLLSDPVLARLARDRHAVREEAEREADLRVTEEEEAERRALEEAPALDDAPVDVLPTSEEEA